MRQDPAFDGAHAPAPGIERDWAFAVAADLPQLYRAYDQLRELAAQPGTQIVAAGGRRVDVWR